MSEEPVDLTSLRTPPPLGPHDYAAVRARVMSEIRTRQRTRWQFLVPLAAALLLAFLSIRSEAPVPSDREQRVSVEPPAVVTAVPVIEPEIETTPAPPVRKQTQTASRQKVQDASPEPVRIHIQTADPDVRIIWIVKENS